MTRNPIRIAAAAAVLHVSILGSHVHVNSFAPSALSRISSIQKHPSTNNQKWQNNGLPTPTCLGSENGSGSSDEEAQRLKEKANQYRNEAEKLRLTLGLQKIEELESEIRDFMKGSDDDASSSSSKKLESDKLQELKDRVEDLVRGSLGKEEAENMLSTLSAFSSNPSTELEASKSDSTLPELTDDELFNAGYFLAKLPKPMKDTLARAAGYPNYDSDPVDLVKRLYAKNKELSTEELRRLYFQSFSENLPTPANAKTAEDEKNEEYELSVGMAKILASAIEDEMKNSTRAMELFPRTVQDAEEDVLPTEADANVIFQLLEKSFMATEKPQRVKGGYIIRGVNKRKSASELLDILDGKLAKTNPQWTDNFQLNFVEIYSDATEELFEDAILITPNRFAPMAPKLLAAVITVISLFSSFVYCIDAFGENPAVMEKLKGAAEIAQNGGVYDLSWFNGEFFSYEYRTE